MWQGLFGNLAVVALVISGWVNAQHLIERRPRAVRSLVFGLAMGCGAVASMLMAVRLDGGALIDLRTTLVALAGFFGGPIAALVSSAIACAYRLAAGGQTALMGCFGIILASGTGLAGYLLFRNGKRTWMQVLVVSVATAVTPMLATASGSTIGPAEMLELAILVTLLKIAVTFGAACLLLQGIRITEEHGLLRSAVSQAPDFFYVKDLQSAFIAANRAVAELNGYTDPRKLSGKTDHDLTTAERADKLTAIEQRVLATGTPVSDFEEQLVGADGQSRWFSTAKAPIYNADNAIVGLAGSTRDITEHKRLERELVESRNQLSYVLTEMSDGLALFDRGGTLIFCNERYRANFPLTAEDRKPGAHIRDILRAVVRTGEQRDIPSGASESWVERIAGGLHQQSEQEINLYDGRWMQLRTRPTSDGGSVVVVSDVTTIKQAEVAMQNLAEQLRQLASTDSLTGLLNRRAFDEALEREVMRSGRDLTPISLLMIDVDRFKAYNDIYGHPAGDACLKALGECIKASLHRPADTAARYGGEEFVVILPNTDDDGAYAVAENLRAALRQRALVHEGSEKKLVTVSIGIGSYGREAGRRRAPEILLHADEALYTAKEAGRDRITGWRPRHPVQIPRAASR